MRTNGVNELSIPRVAVLLAVYNGLEWLPQQIKSILEQHGVEVTIFISVDSSDDGTEQYLLDNYSEDSRIVILPFGKRFKKAGLNFYRLIEEAEIEGFEYVALSDQDDVWVPNKLKEQVRKIKIHGAAAVSTNVVAFWPDGSSKLINKAQPQTQFDFLFESAGPGCTFLMTSWLITVVRHQLLMNSFASRVELHDWLIYAICRSYGRNWLIDPMPSVLYRQHSSNVIGANVGFKALVSRLTKIKSGWYKKEIIKILRVVLDINQSKEILEIYGLLLHMDIWSRFRLFRYLINGRRKFTESLLLAFTVALLNY